MLGAVAAGTGAFLAARPSGAPAPGRGADRRAGAPGFTIPAARVAWVDDSGRLHVGNLATRAQRVVARVNASPTDPVIPAGGSLYWSTTAGVTLVKKNYVEALNLATGQVSRIAAGQSVFASPGGRHIYITQSPTRLLELSARSRAVTAHLAAPAGWHLPEPLGGWAVAGGIIVTTGPGTRSRPRMLGIWQPRTGHVQVIGDDSVFDAYTPPGDRYSLIAWQPDSCTGRSRCPTVISSGGTGTEQMVRSPLRFGFTYGGAFARGAFSPDGSQLAVFVNTSNPQDPRGPGTSELAIARTTTGALRLVPPVKLVTAEDVGWARWLPGSQFVLAGAANGSYLVNTVTLAAKPFSFFGQPLQSPDINYSTTVLPTRSPRPPPSG